MLAGVLTNGWKAGACERVQQIYDMWEQDADGVDEVYGGGGICDNVATALVEALQAAGHDAFTLHYEQDNHTVAVALMDGRTVEVNIPLHLYERGSWYSYKKVEGVRFAPQHITVIELGGPDEFERLQEES